MRRVITLVVALACASGAVACGNPVQDNLINSLGPEKRGVPRGPLHRPGQPCLACHSAAGHREPYFSVAGTVYQTQDSTKPAKDVVVDLTDVDGNVLYTVGTNCAGNFYVQQADFRPVYPIQVRLHYGGLKVPQMVTAINRDGSCATCHTDPQSETSAGHIYFAATVIQPSTGCR